MAIRIEGVKRYVTNPKTGKIEEYVPYFIPDSLSIDGKKIYEFNEKTGLLRLSLSEGDLEKLSSSLRKISEKGIFLSIPIPLLRKEHHFSGVKKIERIENQEPIISLSYVEKL